MHFVCALCGSRHAPCSLDFRCACGGFFDVADVDEAHGTSISLGEVKTPLLRRRIDGVDLHLKLDYFMPTGSFKDRGARFLVSVIRDLNVREVVEDSSGNAGAAVAAYCAAAGIRCRVFVPESTALSKTAQIEAYGGRVERIAGNRDATSTAVLEAARTIYYASHVYNPLFLEGTATLAAEIWEQIGVPGAVVSPLGNGTLLLGLYKGFKRIGSLPRIIGVQSASCAPIYARFHGVDTPPRGDTVAEGIAVGRPARAEEIVRAVRESGGDIVVVDDAAVRQARQTLAHMGIYVEPTAAAAVAGAIPWVRTVGQEYCGQIVVPLTGSGLKK